MVKEEVDHFTCIRENGEKPERWGRARAASEGVEAGQEAAGSEGFPADAGSKFPVLGSGCLVWMRGFKVPVNQLGDILEGLDELVYAISFG